MKARNDNGQIRVYGQLPNTWKNYDNFRAALVEVLEAEGFFDVIKPEYDPELQYLGPIYFDEMSHVFTYPVIDKTPQELAAEVESRLQALDEQVDFQALKRLLQKVAEPVLSDEQNLTEQDVEDAKTLYKQWRATGIFYKKGEKVVYNDKLYSVTSSHTSQADWTPDVAVSLFGRYRAVGEITEWGQPDGAGGPNYPYYLGDKVTHNGSTWESTVANNEDGTPGNVWEPGVYGWNEV
jgi:hypothetical protein